MRFDPSTTGGNHSLVHPSISVGPFDQRAVEARADVLVFTGAALTAPLDVTGPVEAVLFVSSSAPDTDFTARLVDVQPDGRALNLCEGVLRARYRDSIEEPTLMRPGEVYELRIDLGSGARLEYLDASFGGAARVLNFFFCDTLSWVCRVHEDRNSGRVGRQ